MIVNGPRLRCARKSDSTLGPGHHLVAVVGSSVPFVLSSEEAAVAFECREFKRIEEHVEDIARLHTRCASKRRVAALLEQLVRRGVLIPEDDALPTRRTEQDTSMGAVGVLIRGWPDFRASVQSVATHCSRPNQNLVVVIADASNEENAEHRATIRSLLHRADARAHWLTRQTRQWYCTRLARRTGVPLSLLSSAVVEGDDHGCGAGVALNALLLTTSGQKIVIVDGATRCEPYRSTDSNEDVVFDSVEDPRTVRRFRSVDEAMRSVERIDRDILAEHGRVLARTPAECLAGVASVRSPWGKDVDGDLLECIRSDQGSVLLTCSSMIGYADANDSPSSPNDVVSRATRSVVVSNRSVCATECLGLDNRTCLPPLIPTGTQYATLFRAVLRHAHPTGLAAFVPTALWHGSPARRATTKGPRLWRHCGYTASDLVTLVVQSLDGDVFRSRPEARLVRLGRLLVELASARIREFASVVNTCVAADLAKRIAPLERSHHAPAFPACRDLRRDDTDTASGWDALRRVMDAYGHLLICWPSIRAAAREEQEELWSLMTK